MTDYEGKRFWYLHELRRIRAACGSKKEKKAAQRALADLRKGKR